MYVCILMFKESSRPNFDQGSNPCFYFVGGKKGDSGGGGVPTALKGLFQVNLKMDMCNPQNPPCLVKKHQWKFILTWTCGVAIARQLHSFQVQHVSFASQI